MHECGTNALRLLESAADSTAGGVVVTGFLRPLAEVPGLENSRAGLGTWMSLDSVDGEWLSVFNREHTDHEVMRLAVEHDFVSTIHRDSSIRWGTRIGAILAETAVRRGQGAKDFGTINRMRQSMLQFEQLKQGTD